MPVKKSFVGVNKAKFSDNSQQKHIDSLAKNISILVGQTKNKDDRAVLYRDLKELGLVSKGGQISSINFSGGLGGGSGGGGGGVVNPPTETPTKPLNVSVNAAFTTIMIQWDFPSYAGHKHTEIWRNTVDQLGDMLDPRTEGEAVLVATTPDSVYVDSVNFDTGYYYWVRFINVNDEAGAVHSASGSYAKTQKDITTVIDEIEADIDAQFLAFTNSFNQALADADNAIAIADGKAQSALDDIDNRVNIALGNLDQGIIDANAELVAVDNLLDTLRLDHDGLQATVTVDYYDKVSTDSAIAGAITTFQTSYVDTNYVSVAYLNTNVYTKVEADLAITNEVTTRISAIDYSDYATKALLSTSYRTAATQDTATTQQINTAISQIDYGDFATTALLTSDYRTAATQDTATTNQINTAISNIDNGGLVTSAFLSSNYRTSVDQDTATTSQINTAISAIDYGDFATTAFIESDYRTAVTQDTATTNAINAFQSSVLTPNYKTTAQIATDHYTKTATDTAIAGAITVFNSNVLTPNYKTSAQITADHYTKATTDTAISSAVDTLESKIFNADGTTVSSAFIGQVRISTSDLNGAVAQGIDDYSVSYGGQSYSIAQVTQASIDADGNYQTQWGVQSAVGDLNFGVGFLNNNGVTTFAVSANNFGVYNPANGVLELAFTVVDGAIVARKAIIEDAQIRDLIVQNNSIFEGDVLVNSKLTAARIHGARISAGDLWLRGGSHALSFSPTGNFAMWFGSNSFYNPDSSVDTRSTGNAKFAITQAGGIIARGIDIYNNSNQLLLSAGGGLNGAYIENLSVNQADINDLSVGTLDIQGNAVNITAYLESTGSTSSGSFKNYIDQTISTGSGTVFASFSGRLQNLSVEPSTNDFYQLELLLYSGATLVDTFTTGNLNTLNNTSFSITGAATITGTTTRVVVRGLNTTSWSVSAQGFMNNAKR